MKSLENFIINRFTEIIFAFALSWLALVAYGIMMS